MSRAEVELQKKHPSRYEFFVCTLKALLRKDPRSGLKRWCKFLKSRTAKLVIAKARAKRREQLSEAENDWFLSELEVAYVNVIYQLAVNSERTESANRNAVSQALTSLLKRSAKDSSTWCNDALHAIASVLDDEQFCVAKSEQDSAVSNFKEEVDMNANVGTVYGPVGQVVQKNDGKFEVVLSSDVDVKRWEKAAASFNSAAASGEGLVGPDHRVHSANNPDAISNLLGSLSKGELSARIQYYELDS